MTDFLKIARDLLPVLQTTTQVLGGGGGGKVLEFGQKAIGLADLLLPLIKGDPVSKELQEKREELRNSIDTLAGIEADALEGKGDFVPPGASER